MRVLAPCTVQRWPAAHRCWEGFACCEKYACFCRSVLIRLIRCWSDRYFSRICYVPSTKLWCTFKKWCSAFCLSSESRALMLTKAFLVSKNWKIPQVRPKGEKFSKIWGIYGSKGKKRSRITWKPGRRCWEAVRGKPPVSGSQATRSGLSFLLQMSFIHLVFSLLGFSFLFLTADRIK